MMACRRNYSAVFNDIQNTPALMDSDSVVLTLIGHGNLQIPPALQGKVEKRVSLQYKVWLQTSCAVSAASCSTRPVWHDAWSYKVLESRWSTERKSRAQSDIRQQSNMHCCIHRSTTA